MSRETPGPGRTVHRLAAARSSKDLATQRRVVERRARANSLRARPPSRQRAQLRGKARDSNAASERCFRTLANDPEIELEACLPQFIGRALDTDQRSITGSDAARSRTTCRSEAASWDGCQREYARANEISTAHLKSCPRI